MFQVLIVAKCIVNTYTTEQIYKCHFSINSSKVYCKSESYEQLLIKSPVLIVAKCIVNDSIKENLTNATKVLIVAKCIVNE